MSPKTKLYLLNLIAQYVTRNRDATGKDWIDNLYARGYDAALWDILKALDIPDLGPTTRKRIEAEAEKEEG